MTHPTLTRRTTLFAIALCDLAMMSLAIALNLLPIFLTTLAHDLGHPIALTDEQLGRIGAVIFAGLVVGIVLTGPLADRLGPRLFAVSGNALIAIGLAALGFAPNYRTVLIAAFIMGTGAGSLDMILSPIVSALSPDRRTVAMNLLHSFYCIGAVATILAGALALRSGISWRTLALGLTPMPLTFGIAFGFLALPPLIEAGQSRLSIRSLLKEKFFLVALAAIFLGGSTELGMAYWLPAYAEKTLGYSRWLAGISFLLFSLAMAVGRIGILLLPKNFSALRLMFACCAVSIVLFIGASFSTSPILALTCCILTGLTASCLWPSTLAVAADRFPDGGASMFGILAAFGNIGGIFMPWLVGTVADRSSLRWGLSTATFCPALMMIALAWMGRNTNRG